MPRDQNITSRPIVAELGRSETPEETATRKAKNSRAHRQRQTLRNLVLALAASLGIVVVLVLIAPRGTFTNDRSVDVLSIAAKVSTQVQGKVVVPTVPSTWKSNAAEIRRSSDGVVSWYVGYLTPETSSNEKEKNEYLGFYQGFAANATWVSDLVGRTKPTTTVTINDVEWVVHDNRKAGDSVGNARYAMTTVRDGSTFVLLGTADPDTFTTLAATLSTSFLAENTQ